MYSLMCIMYATYDIVYSQILNMCNIYVTYNDIHFVNINIYHHFYLYFYSLAYSVRKGKNYEGWSENLARKLEDRIKEVWDL